MPVEAIPVSPNTGSYVEVAEAEELAATFPGLPAWTAAAPAARAAALNQASADIDAAMAYQGRPLEEYQARQFPRVAYESTSLPRADVAGGAAAGRVVWDWDFTTNQAVIPLDVKLAVLHQAEAVLAGTREPRIALQHDGVVYDQTGSLAESYKHTTGPGVATGLCRRSWVLMRQYRLRGGRLL
jgi:DnaT-like ssDNA binding protein